MPPFCLVASLPCYLPANTDQQRCEGVFEKSKGVADLAEHILAELGGSSGAEPGPEAVGGGM
jgi:hypothetical protein